MAIDTLIVAGGAVGTTDNTCKRQRMDDDCSDSSDDDGCSDSSSCRFGNGSLSVAMISMLMIDRMVVVVLGVGVMVGV